jgi:hypothetical protein
MSSSKARGLPQLSSGEVTLLDLAADDPRDTVSFSDKEALIVQLYQQIQEQELEKALLEQGMSDALVYFLKFSLNSE